jgi:tRNA (mo5U34)-methyltransferase
MDDLSALCKRAVDYDSLLKTKRLSIAPSSFWYPYRTMGNFSIIDQLLHGNNRHLFGTINPKRAADIGGADGDISFFMEQEGWDMTLIDNPSTNWNGLKGARLYRDTIGSTTKIVEMNLDEQFHIQGRFDLAFFLGILYHIKNPFYVLEQLARTARYALLSTRIMRWSAPREENRTTHDPRQLMERLPVAYLLRPDECNNDCTNYWIFSDAGLRRILDRTGWNIEDYMITGAVEEADPFSSENDGRAFCLIKSRFS